MCDVTLKTEIDGEEIHAHRCVIASNSEYFEKMFVGGFKESNQKLIIIEGIDHTTLRHLIDFMYSGKLVAIDAENVEVMIFIYAKKSYHILSHYFLFLFF